MNFSAKSVKLLPFWRKEIDSSWQNIEFSNYLLEFFGLKFFSKFPKKPVYNAIFIRSYSLSLSVSTFVSYHKITFKVRM